MCKQIDFGKQVEIFTLKSLALMEQESARTAEKFLVTIAMNRILYGLAEKNALIVIGA